MQFDLNLKQNEHSYSYHRKELHVDTTLTTLVSCFQNMYGFAATSEIAFFLMPFFGQGLTKFALSMEICEFFPVFKV